MGKLTVWLKEHLKLAVNEAKSAVARPWERKFLGLWSDPGAQAEGCGAEHRAIQGCDSRGAARRPRTQPCGDDPAHSIRSLRGWMAYFRLTETKRALDDLDGWIRRKLRCLVWRQWKRVLHPRPTPDCTRTGSANAHGRVPPTAAARGGTRGPPTCMRRSRRRGSMLRGWRRWWTPTGASRLLHEPPDAEPHVRWCERATGVTPSPTRSIRKALSTSTQNRPVGPEYRGLSGSQGLFLFAPLSIASPRPPDRRGGSLPRSSANSGRPAKPLRAVVRRRYRSVLETNAGDTAHNP